VKQPWRKDFEASDHTGGKAELGNWTLVPGQPRDKIITNGATPWANLAPLCRVVVEAVLRVRDEVMLIAIVLCRFCKTASMIEHAEPLRGRRRIGVGKFLRAEARPDDMRDLTSFMRLQASRSLARHINDPPPPRQRIIRAVRPSPERVP
jgi:hypothetical protein